VVTEVETEEGIEAATEVGIGEVVEIAAETVTAAETVAVIVVAGEAAAEGGARHRTTSDVVTAGAGLTHLAIIDTEMLMQTADSGWTDVEL